MGNSYKIIILRYRDNCNCNKWIYSSK